MYLFHSILYFYLHKNVSYLIYYNNCHIFHSSYGRPRQSTTSFPVFTPAPRQPHQPTTASTFQQQRGSGIGTGRYTESSPPHEITFSAAPNYKKLYLIGLIVVTLLLLSLIAVIIVLLATKGT